MAELLENELLAITYSRVITTDNVILTTANCNEYGYTATTIKNDDFPLGATVFYKTSDEEQKIASYIKEGNSAKTEILKEELVEYTHIAPPCSDFKISFADVDKEGSGRNSNTGEMTREKLGSYTKIDIAWDLIPNTKEYNNWYKILINLPSKVKLTFRSPQGIDDTKEFYRGDISTELYLFIKDCKIWRGLSTSFIQWNIDKYDESYEPELE